jgi:hypothetical protein
MISEKLIDPQALTLTATGAEAEALEAAWQARVHASYSADFHREMDALVDAIIAGREAAEETDVGRQNANAFPNRMQRSVVLTPIPVVVRLVVHR